MVNEKLTTKDFMQLGLLQVLLLPGSMTARFGTAYARAFYRYVARSRNEIMFVHRCDSEIVAFCVVSLKPRTLLRRLVFNTPLIVYALPHIIAPWLWKVIIEVAHHHFADAFPSTMLPELMLLGCAPQFQGLGYGSLLAAEAENALRARGYMAYLVRTFDDEDNPAVKFYLHCGFSAIARFVSHGTPFRLMHKPL